MKTRNGFISNSSSTSYIIVLNKEINKCPHCGRSDPNLLETISASTSYDEDTHIYAVGLKKVIEALGSCYRKDLINQTKSLNDTETEDIAYISISYHDDVIKNILDNLVASGNARIIWSENE